MFKKSNNKSKGAAPMKLDIKSPKLFQMISKRAYELYLKRGNKSGDALSDWLKAEAEIKKEYRIY